MNIRELQRKSRLATILRWFNEAKSNDIEIDREKLINTACFEFGCSRRTAMEYLKVLKGNGKIEL